MSEALLILEDHRDRRAEQIEMHKGTRSKAGKEKLAWCRKCHREICKAIRILKKYG